MSAEQAMTEQTARGRAHDRTQHAGGAQPREAGSIDVAWLRFRDELDARLLARFGVAFDAQAGDHPDPDVLADLALERALMP